MKRLCLLLMFMVLAAPGWAGSKVYFNAINDTVTAGHLILLSASQSGVGGHHFSAESTAVLQVDECDRVNLFLRVMPNTGDTARVTIAVGLKTYARAPWESGFVDSLDGAYIVGPVIPATAAIADSVAHSYTTYAFATTNRTVFPGEFVVTLNPHMGYGVASANQGGVSPPSGGGDHSPHMYMIPLSIGRSSPGIHTRFLQIRLRLITSGAAALTTKHRLIAHVECVGTAN